MKIYYHFHSYVWNSRLVFAVGYIVTLKKIYLQSNPEHEYDTSWKKKEKRLFTDISKWSISKWDNCGFLRWTLNPVTSVLIRNTERKDVQGEVEKPKEDKVSNQNCSAPSQGMAVASRSWKRHGKIALLEPLVGTWLFWHLDLELLASKTMRQ